MHSGKEIIELRHRIDESKGKDVRSTLFSLKTTYLVFEKNYRELKTTIGKYNKGEVSLIPYMLPEKKSDADNIFIEITRVFYNYLSSALSLRDHERSIRNCENEDSAFVRNNDDKVKKLFIDVPKARFIQDLRNYTVHRSLPITGAEVKVNQEKQTQKVFIDAVKIKKWHGWTSVPKKYLKTIDKHIDIEEISDDYFDRATSFYKWFSDEYRILYSCNLSELGKLEKRWDEIHKENQAEFEKTQREWKPE